MSNKLSVPRTLDQALDSNWLTHALAPVSSGASVTSVETVEVIRTVATKVRFTVTFDGAERRREAFCLKGLLDVDADLARGGAVTVLEADFYGQLAPSLPVRVPDCAVTVIDREAQFGVVIMRDLIAQGARFCSAMEAFTVDEAAQSLEQLCRLHTGGVVLDQYPWITRRVAAFARGNYVPLPTLQQMLDGPRGEGLPARTRNAELLLRSMGALAALDESGPDVLVHGDSHAGNIFRTKEGPGLIDWQVLQRGGWALDVAYHIAAVLPVGVAETSERTLLRHYLDIARHFGGHVPADEEAWTQYRAAAVYGYYLWSITRRVEPAIINIFVGRLGASVTRHDSFRLLGV
jgi:Phosphotransferase enzyme family